MIRILSRIPAAMRRASLSFGLLAGVGMATSADAASITIEDNDLNNLFDVTQPVQFKAAVHDVGAGSGEVTVEITPFGREKRTVKVPVESADGGTIQFTIDLGEMTPGYYELDASLQYRGNDGQTATADYSRPIQQIRGEEKFNTDEPFSFGVAPFVERTAAEARDQGVRFGLKLWQLGSPGVWWRPGETYDINTFIDSSVKLGLQWTRHDFPARPRGEDSGRIGNHELIENHEVLVVWKVEGFPVGQMWDEQRYGPLEAWREKNRNKNPSRSTVPLKAPYQEWLKDLVNALPPEQTVFEIGNEVWNYMPGDQFAEWAQMAVEAIKEARPDAKVGVDPGYWDKNAYFETFLAAGGFENMDIIFSHPYSFTPQPEHRIRQILRNIRVGLKDRTGQDFEIYVTEYGWPTAPEDRRGHSVSEALQAMRTTRQSLMLYAEDVKALIPHWAADREYDVTEREHFFGFYRLSGAPKPVLIAHANAARMIDTSRFVGDLWYGPGIGAMLFERNGEHTLALWTMEEDRTVEIDAGAAEVTVVDLMGASETRQTDNGKLTLQLSGSVTYVVGVGEIVAEQATPPDQPLNPDRWGNREGSIAASPAGDLQIDGNLAEWSDSEPVKLAGTGDASAEAMFMWDDDTFYAAIRVSDAGDDPGEFVLNLSAQPSLASRGRLHYDWAFTLTPSPEGDAATLTVRRGLTPGQTDHTGGSSDAGHRWAIQRQAGGWTAELALPISAVDGFPEPSSGQKIAVRLDYKRGEQTQSFGAQLAHDWPYLTFEK